MIASSQQQPPPRARVAPTGTAAAPLLYWLLVVCGLVGLTIVRLDSTAIVESDVTDLVPVWMGSILGVALGQLLSWLRVRAWLPIVIMLGAFWCLPLLYFILFDAFGNGMSTFTLAFLPAAVCGYLSLTERGALVAFWYPAVLWMLVILDGPTPGSFNARAALPFAIGLAGLFVAFLRARETRRVAIWQTHGSVRIAPPVARIVLRASPLRGVSQLVWTSFVGAGALVLAAWIAPHLWQKEKAKHAKTTVEQMSAMTSTPSSSTWASGAKASASTEEPCCAGLDPTERKRVREYFPVQGSKEEREHEAAVARCAVCRSYQRMAAEASASSSTSSTSSSGLSYEGPYVSAYTGEGAYNGGAYNGGYAYGGNTGGVYDPYVLPAPTPYTLPTPNNPPPTTIAPSAPVVTPEVQQLPLPLPITPPTPTEIKPKTKSHAKASPKPVPPAATPTPTPIAATPAPAPSPPSSSSPPAVTPSTQTTVAIAPIHTAPKDTGSSSPWKWTLAFCALGLTLHALTRMVRRNLTLRHLARPFWSETLDQRISNHWQRMLIGLGDMGIHPIPDEQPQAFAKRVGRSINSLDLMRTCATILERVRHGVRVDASDLDTMDAAATAVYRTARSKAGPVNRMTSWLRWPLV